MFIEVISAIEGLPLGIRVCLLIYDMHFSQINLLYFIQYFGNHCMISSVLASNFIIWNIGKCML